MDNALPQAVQDDIHAGFVITDRDNYYQRSKVLGDGRFHFKTGYPGFRVRLDDIDYPGQPISQIVDINDYDAATKQRMINTYYNDREDFEAACEPDERDRLLAEMIYETDFELDVYEGA